MGGTLLGGIALAPGCKAGTTGNPALATPASSVPTTPSETPTSPPFTSSAAITTPAASTPALSTPAVPAISGTQAFAASAADGSYYRAPAAQPAVLRLTGSDCTVATDRLYSSDHVWVKSIAPDMAVLGITPTMVTIIARPYALELPKLGTLLEQNDAFGDIEGVKLSTSMITPISGQVVQLNEVVVREGMGAAEIMTQVNSDPWNGGWMIVMKLSKPDELKGLMTAQDYKNKLLAMEQGLK